MDRATLPRIIHQTWRISELPILVDRCVATVRELNPDFECRLYTDEDWKAIIDRCPLLPWEIFTRFPEGVQRADLFRMIVLYLEGGVYIDVDTICYRPLNELLACAVELGIARDEVELLLTTDHPIHSRDLYQGKLVIMNNFVVAKPGSRVIKEYLLRMAAFATPEYKGVPSDPTGCTGPGALTEVIESMGGVAASSVALLPWNWINPLPDMPYAGSGVRVYESLIASGNWRRILDPYFVHCWWHSYISPHNMLSIYHERLFSAPNP